MEAKLQGLGLRLNSIYKLIRTAAFWIKPRIYILF